MITWDGVLQSMERRAEYARLGFPLRLIHSAPAGFGSAPAVPVMHTPGPGTAAGTPNPHRDTGSHHHNKDEQR